MDEKSSLPGLLRIIAPGRLPTHPRFGYIWLRLGSSFSELLRTFPSLVLERALLLQPLSLMTNPDGLSVLTQSLLCLSHLLAFSLCFFFFFYTSYMCLRSSPNPEDFNSKKCFWAHSAEGLGLKLSQISKHVHKRRAQWAKTMCRLANPPWDFNSSNKPIWDLLSQCTLSSENKPMESVMQQLP